MTDFPPPPAGYDGDYSRPLDPQFVDPQYGRAPLYRPQPPPPPAPRPSSRRNAVALAVLSGLVVVLALVLTVLSVSAPDETRGLEVLPPATVPATPGPPSSSLVPTQVPDLEATVVGVRYFEALDTGDQVELQQLECAGFDATVPLDLADATPSGAATVDGATATMDGSVLLTDGTGYDLTATMRRQGTSWCISGLTKR